MIKELASKFVAPYEAEILVGLVIGLFVFCLWEVHHQRQIGAAQVIAADAKARSEEHAKVVAEEARIQAVVDTADARRRSYENLIDQFERDHPVGSVRLCKPAGHQPAGVPSSGATAGGTAGTGPGSITVPEVLGGSAGPDIGPDVDAILSAAETVDGLYQATQQVNHAHP